MLAVHTLCKLQDVYVQDFRMTRVKHPLHANLVVLLCFLKLYQSEKDTIKEKNLIYNFILDFILLLYFFLKRFSFSVQEMICLLGTQFTNILFHGIIINNNNTMKLLW